MILRPYQLADLAGIRALFAKGHQRVLHVLPTSGGKTQEFAEMVRLAHGRNMNTVILVGRDSLLTQASQKLKAIGVKHGIIAPGHNFYGDTVHVASINTLVRRLDKFDFNFIVVDESHHATSPTYAKIFASYPKAKVLGVTATPIRGDGRGLDSVFQAMHLGPSIKDLIDDGYITEPDTYGPKKMLDLSRVRNVAGDYDKKQLSDAMDDPHIVGDAIEHYAAICPGVPAVVFAINIKKAEDAAIAFRAAGFRSESIHGKMPLALIRQRIAALASGAVQILATCDLVSEGLDLPAIVCAINLRPTKSVGLHIQQAGRALRPMYAFGFDLRTREGRLAAIAAGPKPRAIILDHAANCFRHMTVDEPRTWTLAGRKRRGGKSGPTMSLTQCPACLRPHKPSPKCPHIKPDGTPCGHIYTGQPRELNEVAGTLEKVDKVALRRAQWGEEHSCKTLDELVELGKARKYRYAKLWAERRWQFIKPRVRA